MTSVPTTPSDRSRLREQIAEWLNCGWSDSEIASELSSSGNNARSGLVAAVAVIRDLMTDKIPCRVVVSLFGGTVDAVAHDNEQVDITDVVFLEDSKYASEEVEFHVDAKRFAGSFVYTHTESVVANAADFAAVMQAAKLRSEHGDRAG